MYYCRYYFDTQNKNFGWVVYKLKVFKVLMSEVEWYGAVLRNILVHYTPLV